MSKKEGALLQFAPMQSSVDEGFWYRFSSLKLNKRGVDDSPLPIIGSSPFLDSLPTTMLFLTKFTPFNKRATSKL
ncbi:hypothetical protein S83_041916 [Arachis hypogaea]